MKKNVIATIRAIAYVLILIITLVFVIDLTRLHVSGSGVTYQSILFEIIFLFISVLTVMLLHFEKKQGQLIYDLKMISLLILIGFLPLIFFILLFIFFLIFGLG